MRPICVECQKEMSCEKNGVLVKVNVDYYYAGDLYTCLQCNRSIIKGFSHDGFSLIGPVDDSKIVADLTKG